MSPPWLLIYYLMGRVPLLSDCIRGILTRRGAGCFLHLDPAFQFTQALKALDVILARIAGVRVDVVGGLVAIKWLATIVIRTNKFRCARGKACTDLSQSLFDAVQICIHFLVSSFKFGLGRCP